MQNPKDVLVWEYAPGRRLAQFVVHLKNTKGALAICAQALAQYKINLLSGFHTAPSASAVGVWSFFADVTESTISPEAIAERLRSLPFVESVEIYKSRDGFMVDDKHFPLKSAGRRVIMMRTHAVTEMLSRLWDVFGSGAATIIDEMGEAMGRFRAQEIVSDFGADFAVENLTQFLKIFTAFGFAELEIESFDKVRGTLALTVRELFECNERRGLENTRKSVFFKGHLRGFMSTIFNTPFEVLETECVSSGSKSCRFHLSRLATPTQRLTARV
jgi:predicted hydrocarbon binding protein